MDDVRGSGEDFVVETKHAGSCLFKPLTGQPKQTRDEIKTENMKYRYMFALTTHQLQKNLWFEMHIV